MNKHWGEPDDIEPFPDWMLPPNKRQNIRPKAKSLADSIEEALKKPPIPNLPDQEPKI